MKLTTLVGMRFWAHLSACLVATAISMMSVTGCGGGGGGKDAPINRDVTGRYQMATLNGRSVPTTIFTMSTGVAATKLYGIVEINENGSFTCFQGNATYYGKVKAFEEKVDGDGTWERTGNTLHLKQTSGVGLGTLTLLPDGSLIRNYNMALPEPSTIPNLAITEIWRKQK